MSRLINADALLQEIEGLSVHIIGLRSGKGALYNFMNEYRKTVLRIIDEQPTAFDTEKVVEQIHDKYCHKCRNILGKQSSEEYCKSVKCEIDALCDIVKKGGVE